MLGDVTASGISLWFRPLQAEKLTVEITAEGANKKQKFPVSIAQPGAAVRVKLNGLAANTAHSYRIVHNTGKILTEGSFRTAPAANSGETIRIAFGSCQHKIGVHNPNLMRLIKKRGNHAMLLLGNLAVDDHEAQTNLHYADYLLRDVSKSWRTFSAGIPVYTCWDDVE